jgi:hypothetical protein
VKPCILLGQQIAGRAQAGGGATARHALAVVEFDDVNEQRKSSLALDIMESQDLHEIRRHAPPDDPFSLVDRVYATQNTYEQVGIRFLCRVIEQQSMGRYR